VAVLAAVMLVFLVGMAAFAVDLAYLGLVREQMQTAADSAALAASDELVDAWSGQDDQLESALANARTVAATTAMANQMSGKPGTYIDGNRDLRFGTRLWDGELGTFVETWGQPPYNLVEVTVRRTGPLNESPDDAVPLFLARILGHERVSLQTKSVVALLPGNGFRVDDSFNGTLPILPIVCDEETWDDHWDWSPSQSGGCLHSSSGFADDYSVGYNNGQVSSEPDGIPEINIYPSRQSRYPSGNRGTVDFGASNNSTRDLKRQIEYGLNADDLAELGVEIVPPLVVDGDPGISAGIKCALSGIIGQKRILPIFSSVSGHCRNTRFTIVKFVAVHVVSVKLTGCKKYLKVQRCTFSHPLVTPATAVSSERPTLMSPGVVLR